jgi:hypothetical protein
MIKAFVKLTEANKFLVQEHQKLVKEHLYPAVTRLSTQPVFNNDDREELIILH